MAERYSYKLVYSMTSRHERRCTAYSYSHNAQAKRDSHIHIVICYVMSVYSE